MGLRGKKVNKCCCLTVSILLGFAPFLHFPWGVFQSCPQTPREFRAGQSCEVTLAGLGQTAQLSPVQVQSSSGAPASLQPTFPSHTKSEFCSNLLFVRASFSHNFAYVWRNVWYNSFIQLHFQLLIWKPLVSHFFNWCHLIFKFPSNFLSSEGRIKLPHFLRMHRLCDKAYKQFWSSGKFTARQYCSFN